MPLPSSVLLAFVVLLIGDATALPLKGGDTKSGEDRSTSGGWTQPKDWDWSATTSGRLIPVSEATDDLPTPGYRMVDLRQRVPAERVAVQPLNQVSLGPEDPNTPSQRPTDTSASTTEPMLRDAEEPPSTETESRYKEEAKVENKNEEEIKTEVLDKSEEKAETEPPVSKEFQESVSTTGNTDSSLSTATVEHNEPSQSSTTENLQPTTHKPEERIPVDEGIMTKVILPEICSISGIGCGDRPQKIEPESESPGKLFLEHTERISPSGETEYPGQFFLENSQRISSVENSISNSPTSTENVNKETSPKAEENLDSSSTLYDHLTEKLSLNNSEAVHTTEKPLSDSSQPTSQDNEASNTDLNPDHAVEKIQSPVDNLSSFSDQDNVQADQQIKYQSPVDNLSSSSDQENVQSDAQIEVQSPVDNLSSSSDQENVQSDAQIEVQSPEDNLSSSSDQENVQSDSKMEEKVQPPTDGLGSSSEQDQVQSDKHIEEQGNFQVNEQQKENPLLSLESFQGQQKSDEAVTIHQDHRQINSEEESNENNQKELEDQKLESNAFQKELDMSHESNEDSSQEAEAKTLAAQRRLDVFDNKTPNQEITTVKEETEGKNSTSIPSEQELGSGHTSEISEEEQKLMKEGKVDDQYTASMRQNDDPSTETSSDEGGFFDGIKTFFSKLWHF